MSLLGLALAASTTAVVIAIAITAAVVFIIAALDTVTIGATKIDQATASTESTKGHFAETEAGEDGEEVPEVEGPLKRKKSRKGHDKF